MSEGNPWRRLSRRLVYENPWIRVQEDEVLRPNGGPGIYGVVQMAPAVAVVALTAEDEIVTVGQWRYPLDRYGWEVIEGGAEPGESPQEAAARELAEEAGLKAARWQELAADLEVSNSVTDQRAWIYLATELSEAQAEPDPTEQLKLRRVPRAALMRQLYAGQIKDALSVISLFYAERALNPPTP